MKGFSLAGHCQAEEEEKCLSSAFCAVLKPQRNRVFALLAAGSTFTGINMHKKTSFAFNPSTSCTCGINI